MAEEKNELVITRTFDAPRELVFKAWTEPERIKQWLAPRGFKIPVVASVSAKHVIGVIQEFLIDKIVEVFPIE